MNPRQTISMRKKLHRSIISAALLAMASLPSGHCEESQTVETKNPAAIPAPREDADWWRPRHEKICQRQDKDAFELVFIGDSITQGWESPGKKVWDQYYGSRKAANLGFSGDRTENVLWRIQNGEIDGMQPKLIVLMIGTNNRNSAEDVADGIRAIVAELRNRLPESKILLLGIFPRGKFEDRKNDAVQESGANALWAKNETINAAISGLADARNIYFLNINASFLKDGLVPRQYMPDFLHPNEQGYEVWARAMEPTLEALLDQK